MNWILLIGGIWWLIGILTAFWLIHEDRKVTDITGEAIGKASLMSVLGPLFFVITCCVVFDEQLKRKVILKKKATPTTKERI